MRFRRERRHLREVNLLGDEVLAPAAPTCRPHSAPVGMAPVYALRPNLYRTVRVVLSDGSTFRVPSAVRLVGNTLQLERDVVNHPVYQGLGDQANLTSRREEARLTKLREKQRVKVFED